MNYAEPYRKVKLTQIFFFAWKLKARAWFWALKLWPSRPELQHFTFVPKSGNLPHFFPLLGKILVSRVLPAYREKNGWFPLNTGATLCSVFTRLPYIQESALRKAQFCRYCSRSVKISSFRFCFFLVLGFWLNHFKITAFADLRYFFWTILFKH